jgi:hypothetical protein
MVGKPRTRTITQHGIILVKNPFFCIPFKHVGLKFQENSSHVQKHFTFNIKRVFNKNKSLWIANLPRPVLISGVSV